MEAALNSPLGRTVLGSGAFRIGRASDNTLILQDSQASSHHVEIAPGFDGSGYQVTDLGSTNGTFVNEQQLAPSSPRALNAGDVIRIGQTKITYEVSGAGAGYAPTVAASPPNYAPTVAASDPFAQPAFQQPFAQPAQPDLQQPPSAYGNFNPPAQAPYTPPPAYPQPAYPQPGFGQPQAAYPQAQPVYPQPGGFGQPQPAYPQPAYPQPGFGQPGMLSQKKSNVGLIIAVVVVLVVLIAGGASAYFLTRSTPQKALAAYCDGLKTNNAQEIYDNISSQDQARTSVSKIQTGLQALALLTGGITGCTVNSVQENGSTATASVTLTPAHGPAGNTTIHLTDENGQWKIESNANTL